MADDYGPMVKALLGPQSRAALDRFRGVDPATGETDYWGRGGLAGLMGMPSALEQSPQDVAMGFAGSVTPKVGGVLPMTEAARMSRSRQLGFNTDTFHASDADFGAFNMKRLGSNTDSSPWAQRLAKIGIWSSENPVAHKIGASAEYPLKLRGSFAERASLDALEQEIRASGGPVSFRRKMREEGYDGVRVQDEELGGTSYVSFAPENVRSRFAVFDPARVNSRDLMASLAGAVGFGAAAGASGDAAAQSPMMQALTGGVP